MKKDIERGDIVAVSKQEKYFIANKESINDYERLGYAPQQLCLLSDDGNIKKGDFVIGPNNQLSQVQVWAEGHPNPPPKVIAAYPPLRIISRYEDISNMPIYETLPTFETEFICQWVNNPVDEVIVEYDHYIPENGFDGPVRDILKLTSHNEVTCYLIDTAPKSDEDIQLLKYKSISYTYSDLEEAYFAGSGRGTNFEIWIKQLYKEKV